MLTVKIKRTPYLSTARPTAGEIKMDDSAPKLTEPAINVRLQPNSSAMGDTNTARVVVDGAILANVVVPAANTTIHP
jgi:thioester reductase-like protein